MLACAGWGWPRSAGAGAIEVDDQMALCVYTKVALSRKVQGAQHDVGGVKDYRAARLCLVVVVRSRGSDSTWTCQSEIITVKASSKHCSRLPLFSQ